jgi:hypothetical protein
MAVEIGEPIIEVFNANSSEGIIGELSHMKLNNDLRILLIVLDRNSEKSYKEIKKYINNEVGTPSQVVRLEKLNSNLSYYTNVLAQMIIKMGNRLFSIEFDKNLELKVINFIYIYI